MADQPSSLDDDRSTPSCTAARIPGMSPWLAAASSRPSGVVSDCADVRERFERGEEDCEFEPDLGIVRFAPDSSHASIAFSESFFRRVQSSIASAVHPPLRRALGQGR